MKRIFVLFFFIMLAVTAAFSLNGPVAEVPASAAGPMPFKEHLPGTYFTKNKKACDCHYSTDCVSSGYDCNCMRYYPTGKKSTCDIDLLGVQCMGFARMCQYRLFKTIDYGKSAGDFYNILGGRLKAGSWDRYDAKYYITRAMIGGHIRIAGHSLIIMSISDDGFSTYECNMSSSGKQCIVFTRSWTYKSFYNTYGGYDWLYLNLPTEKTLAGLAPPATLSSAAITTKAPTPSSEALTADGLTETQTTAFTPETNGSTEIMPDNKAWYEEFREQTSTFSLKSIKKRRYKIYRKKIL